MKTCILTSQEGAPPVVEVAYQRYWQTIPPVLLWTCPPHWGIAGWNWGTLLHKRAWCPTVSHRYKWHLSKSRAFRPDPFPFETGMLSLSQPRLQRGIICSTRNPQGLKYPQKYGEKCHFWGMPQRFVSWFLDVYIYIYTVCIYIYIYIYIYVPYIYIYIYIYIICTYIHYMAWHCIAWHDMTLHCVHYIPHIHTMFGSCIASNHQFPSAAAVISPRSCLGCQWGTSLWAPVRKVILLKWTMEIPCFLVVLSEHIPLHWP